MSQLRFGMVALITSCVLSMSHGRHMYQQMGQTNRFVKFLSSEFSYKLLSFCYENNYKLIFIDCMVTPKPVGQLQHVGMITNANVLTALTLFCLDMIYTWVIQPQQVEYQITMIMDFVVQSSIDTTTHSQTRIQAMTVVIAFQTPWYLSLVMIVARLTLTQG